MTNSVELARLRALRIENQWTIRTLKQSVRMIEISHSELNAEHRKLRGELEAYKAQIVEHRTSFDILNRSHRRLQVLGDAFGAENSDLNARIEYLEQYIKLD